MKKPKTVVIVGGGIAGLSAAHELVRRGFDVHLYERRAYVGGKAASVTIPKGDAHGRDGLPGEHGFRFFPGWYRHLPKTMEKIPYRNRTVADNLVPVDVNLFGSYQREPVRALLRLPANLKDVSTLSGFFDGILALGISTDDLKFFLGKLWEFLTASEARRVAVYDNMTWWDFMEADSKERSQAFRDYLVVAATRSTVAANPRQASAYTIAKMAIQSLIDAATPVTPADRVLNGPTQEVFTNPWVEYLREQGVTFHLNAELESIEFHHSRSGDQAPQALVQRAEGARGEDSMGSRGAPVRRRVGAPARARGASGGSLGRPGRRQEDRRRDRGRTARDSRRRRRQHGRDAVDRQVRPQGTGCEGCGRVRQGCRHLRTMVALVLRTVRKSRSRCAGGWAQACDGGLLRARAPDRADGVPGADLGGDAPDRSEPDQHHPLERARGLDGGHPVLSDREARAHARPHRVPRQPVAAHRHRAGPVLARRRHRASQQEAREGDPVGRYLGMG